MNNFKERIDELNDLISKSNNIVFFGGAGVSTESGIPDFRSKDGLYNQHDVKFDDYEPEYLLSDTCLNVDKEVFFEFYRQKLDCRYIEPNITHYKLAELEKRNKLSAIITQNIDGLHQKAGSTNVLEIHGATMRNYCSKCKTTYHKDFIFNTKEKIPTCKCGGVIRPDVTLYGEILPMDVWNTSVKSLAKADLLIVGGTSLTVYPARDLINYYYGEKLVIINRDETEFDNYADLVFHESLGDVFSNIKI